MTVPGDPTASGAASEPDRGDPIVPVGPAAASGPSPGVDLVPPPPSTSDWPAQATDAIVDLVDQVKAKTTGPAITVARGLVFGVIVGVLGIVVAILLLVFLVRITTEVLEHAWDGAGVWLTYLIYGAVFIAVGAVLFRKRHVRGLD